jgi:hypothetical protein
MFSQNKKSFSGLILRLFCFHEKLARLLPRRMAGRAATSLACQGIVARREFRLGRACLFERQSAKALTRYW